MLVDHFDVFGLGLAFSLAYLISAVVALFMMQRKSLGFSANSLLAGLIPILISAGVMAICVRLGSMLFTNHDSAVGLNAAVLVLCGSLIGVTIYVSMLYLFQVSEMRKLFHRH